MTTSDIFDMLQMKLKNLHEVVWHQQVPWPTIQKWLRQFANHAEPPRDEQLQMLFLLSNFMYFGVPELRELLRSMFRDLYRYPLVEQIRRNNSNTTDRTIIDQKFQEELEQTRFMGVGNPSESGSHLLYYFRQESRLARTHFINTHEIFGREMVNGGVSLRVRDPAIRNYVFLDDLCGSGTQAEAYSKDTVTPLKILNPAAKVYYFALFATVDGLKYIRSLGTFDRVSCVMELDSSFKCFSSNSRIYANEPSHFDKNSAAQICSSYGARLWPTHPLGYKDGQLLLSFAHNTPDNTLPIFWYDEGDKPWSPIFRRYSKIYG